MMRFNFDVWPKVGLPMFSILLLSALATAQQKSMPPRTQDRPLESRIESMERAQRDEWQKPDEVVKALDLKPGEVVADVGAGSGSLHLSPLAKVVAPLGKVLCRGRGPRHSGISQGARASTTKGLTTHHRQ